jgi:hypothetical protein
LFNPVGPLITGEDKVLFVKVSAPLNVAKLSSCKAALNSATVPVSVFEVKSIVLFVNSWTSFVPTINPDGRDLPKTSELVKTTSPSILYAFPTGNSKSSEDTHASSERDHCIYLSVSPFREIPPPSAVALDGLKVSPKITFLSSTVRFVVLIFVVVPLTVSLYH